MHIIRSLYAIITLILSGLHSYLVYMVSEYLNIQEENEVNRPAEHKICENKDMGFCEK